jgi:hypothetical protein
MKKINYFLLLLFSITTNAQTIPVGENISLDQQLTNINQSSVSSGIIYERVMQIANIYNLIQLRLLTQQILITLNKLWMK